MVDNRYSCLRYDPPINREGMKKFLSESDCFHEMD
jgi:hypothetical protein